MKNKIRKKLKMHIINSNGYKLHYNPKSPDARADGYSPVHRDNARKKFRKNIKKGECVHHIDGNKVNNKKSNLMIVSNWEHHEIHKAEGKEIWRKNYKKKY